MIAGYDSLLTQDYEEPLTCDECNGSGKVYYDEDDPDMWGVCPECKGEGTIQPPEYDPFGDII